MGIDLDESLVEEPRLFQPKRRSSRSGTNFNRGKHELQVCHYLPTDCKWGDEHCSETKKLSWRLEEHLLLQRGIGVCCLSDRRGFPVRGTPWPLSGIRSR